jgi:hypothetical protein
MYDSHGCLLLPREARAALRRMVLERRSKSCLSSLRKVAAYENGGPLASAVDYFEEHGNLSPKLAWVVLWKLKAYHIDHEPRWFKVALRRIRHRIDLQLMPPDRVSEIWPALSKAQREVARKLGHQGPKQMTPKAAPHTYEDFTRVGWTDAQLIEHGYLKATP